MKFNSFGHSKNNFLGWGLVDADAMETSKTLKMANVTIEKGTVECESGRTRLDNRMLCAKGDDQNVCKVCGK